MFDDFGLDYDEKTGLPVSKENVTVSAPDFGGPESIEYTGPTIFGIKTLGYMNAEDTQAPKALTRLQRSVRI